VRHIAPSVAEFLGRGDPPFGVDRVGARGSNATGSISVSTLISTLAAHVSS